MKTVVAQVIDISCKKFAEMHSLIPGMLIACRKMSWKLDEYVIYKEL
jgi:hypothetical protein